MISDKYPSKISIYSNSCSCKIFCIGSRNWNGSIVEPEVLMDGNHSADECLNKTSEVIEKYFEQMIMHKIDLGELF